MRVERPLMWDDAYKRVGELVRGLRRNAGISQSELARRVCLARTSITNIERGKQRFSFDVFLSLAEALSVSPKELLPIRTGVLRDDIEQRLPKETGGADRRALQRILSKKA